MKRKAEMGVGTLIVFIAMLLVAAVAAGVLIQTAGSLQEKALSTGQQARSQISTNARVIEVSARDGRGGNLTDFQQILKLAPGSDPIKLDQVIFTFNTKDRTSTLKYKGENCICDKNNINGYNTWNDEEMGELENFMGLRVDGSGGIIREDMWTSIDVDLDDDGLTDYVRSCMNDCPPEYNGTYLKFNLSSAGIVYTHLLNDNGTEVNLSDSGTSFSFSHLNISSYGYIEGYRTSGSTAFRITFFDADVLFQLYENPIPLEEDYDDDSQDDYLAINNTHALFFLSSGQNLSVNLGADISTLPATISLSSEKVENTTNTIAYLTVSAITSTVDIIPENATFTIRPYNYGMGYFSVIYEQEGTNHVPGNLQRGDVIKLCYEAPGEITEDELVRLNFIPKIGTSTLTEFVTPDVISTERVYLYP